MVAINPDQPSRSWRNTSIVVGSFCISGFSTGMLAGMSASEVISTIISSLLVAVTAAVVALREIKKSENATSQWLNLRISCMAMAGLSTFLLVGSCLGTYVRTHNYMGMSLEASLSIWHAVGKLPEASVVSRLFDTAYPPQVESAGTASTQESKEGGGSKSKLSRAQLELGVLFSNSETICSSIKNAPVAQRRTAMISSPSVTLQQIGHNIVDPTALQQITDELCGSL